jgi:hypothetical protein
VHLLDTIFPTPPVKYHPPVTPTIIFLFWPTIVATCHYSSTHIHLEGRFTVSSFLSAQYYAAQLLAKQKSQRDADKIMHYSVAGRIQEQEGTNAFTTELPTLILLFFVLSLCQI